MSNTRAQWIEGIPDLYDDDRLAEAGQYLTVSAVSRHTGLATSTIKGALSRTPIVNEANPLGALSRPEARIGSKPLYSQAQADEAKRRRENSAGRRHFGGQDEPLPTITYEEASRCGFASAAEIAEAVGLHEQTIRAWRAAAGPDNFPKAVGNRERPEDQPKGAPSVVFERLAVLDWMVENGKITEAKRDKALAA